MKLETKPCDCALASDLRNTYTVEEHTGGREGIGVGPATGIYTTRAEALTAMCAAYGRGHKATCIVRNEHGSGVAKVLQLSLVSLLD